MTSYLASVPTSTLYPKGLSGGVGLPQDGPNSSFLKTILRMRARGKPEFGTLIEQW